MVHTNRHPGFVCKQRVCGARQRFPFCAFYIQFDEVYPIKPETFLEPVYSDYWYLNKHMARRKITWIVDDLASLLTGWIDGKRERRFLTPKPLGNYYEFALLKFAGKVATQALQILGGGLNSNDFISTQTKRHSSKYTYVGATIENNISSPNTLCSNTISASQLF